MNKLLKPLKEEPLNIAWKEYIDARNKKLFPNEEHKFNHHGTLAEIQDYIKRCIGDVLDENIELPLTREFSSKGMTEFQKLTFLIEETEKALNNNCFFATIIYDEYRIEDGTQGIYEIIESYIKWIDTKK